jgi:hypothetical protein
VNDANTSGLGADVGQKGVLCNVIEASASTIAVRDFITLPIKSFGGDAPLGQCYFGEKFFSLYVARTAAGVLKPRFFAF